MDLQCGIKSVGHWPHELKIKIDEINITRITEHNTMHFIKNEPFSVPDLQHLVVSWLLNYENIAYNSI